MEVTTNPKKPIYKKWWFWVGIVIIVAALGSQGNKSDSSNSETAVSAPTTSTPVATTTAEAAPVATPDVKPLELQSWNWSNEYGYVTAEGSVKNTSGERLENVQVVASFLDAEGNVITSESGMIEYNPILPGQTSPFKAMGKYNPAMKTARVEFKEMFGGLIPHSAKVKASKK